MEFNLLSCCINFVYMRNDGLSLIIIIEDIITIIIITIKTIIHNLASSHCWLTLLFVIEDWNSDIEALSLSIYTSINSKEIDQKKKTRKCLKIANKHNIHCLFAEALSIISEIIIICKIVTIITSIEKSTRILIQNGNMTKTGWTMKSSITNMVSFRKIWFANFPQWHWTTLLQIFEEDWKIFFSGSILISYSSKARSQARSTYERFHKPNPPTRRGLLARPK